MLEFPHDSTTCFVATIGGRPHFHKEMSIAGEVEQNALVAPVVFHDVNAWRRHGKSRETVIGRSCSYNTHNTFLI